jgi:hypothetical protein
MTRFQGRKIHTHWIVQAVHITDPPITSPASLALLSKKFYTQDKSIFSNWRMCRIRKKWMKLQMRNPDSKGGLTCTICGRQGLNPHDKDPYRRNLATIDHIQEISEGARGVTLPISKLPVIIVIMRKIVFVSVIKQKSLDFL